MPFLYIYTKYCKFIHPPKTALTPPRGRAGETIRGMRKGIALRTMKQERHRAIRELIAAAPVLSQDDLRRKLVRRGFAVTQATVSRDIRELNLYKGPQGYSLPGTNGAGDGENIPPSIDDVLRTFGLRVRQALHQLVLLTTKGGAQPIALAIDNEEWPEVVGTIAGDDTVLIICPDHKRATRLRNRLDEMIEA